MKAGGAASWWLCGNVAGDRFDGTVLSITVGGWHDFRHSLSTNLRRAGVHPKVVSDILGHNKVNPAVDVYDRADIAER